MDFVVAAVRAAAVVILVEVGILVVVVARAQDDHSSPSPTLYTASLDPPRDMTFFEPAWL